MIDALSLVALQLAVIVLMAALAGGLLGWLIGSRGRAAAAAPAAAVEAPKVDPAVFAPQPAAQTDNSWQPPAGPRPAEPAAEPDLPQPKPAPELETLVKQREGDTVFEEPEGESSQTREGETVLEDPEEETANHETVSAEEEPVTQAAEEDDAVVEPEPEPEEDPLEVTTVLAPNPKPAQVQPSPTELAAAEEIERLRTRVSELQETLNARESDLMRLETGATTAWDTTVPSLERAIEELKADKEELREALADALARVESTQLELDLVNKARGQGRG